MKASQPIGIFDSGIGGLTVAKAIATLLPNEQILYVGDTQHMPYGDKSPEHIRQYCERIVDFLLSHQVKMIVIACNTASAVAASHLRSLYWEKVEIMGVIRPAILSIRSKGYQKVGIIGTTGTIQSNIYQNLFLEYGSTIDLFQLATPLLAPMIEEGLFGTRISQTILEEYLSHPGFVDKEAILLACTHYPLIRQEVFDFFGGKKDILDNAGPMAETVKAYLENRNLLSTKQQEASRFFVTEYSQSFEQTSRIFHGSSLQVQEIDIHR